MKLNFITVYTYTVVRAIRYVNGEGGIFRPWGSETAEPIFGIYGHETNGLVAHEGLIFTFLRMVHNV